MSYSEVWYQKSRWKHYITSYHSVIKQDPMSTAKTEDKKWKKRKILKKKCCSMFLSTILIKKSQNLKLFFLLDLRRIILLYFFLSPATLTPLAATTTSNMIRQYLLKENDTRNEQDPGSLGKSLVRMGVLVLTRGGERPRRGKGNDSSRNSDKLSPVFWEKSALFAPTYHCCSAESDIWDRSCPSVKFLTKAAHPFTLSLLKFWVFPVLWSKQSFAFISVLAFIPDSPSLLGHVCCV